MGMLQQIIRSMIANIADYSDLLNDNNVITDVTYGAGDATITVTDTLPSNLVVGNTFLIRDALFKNEILTLTPVTGGYQVETTVNHDLTENFQETAQITGFGGSWDDSFTVVSVDSPTLFTISTALGAPSGDGYLLEDRFGTIRDAQIITALTAKTITFATTTPFQLYDLSNATANYNYRITSTFNDESAQEHFNLRTSAKKSWAYVIYNDSSVSKDNTIDSDSRGRHTKFETISQELILNFDILVIKDNSDKNTTRAVQDELLDFRYALLKSVLGLIIEFPNYCNDERYGVSLLGDSGAFYKGAYYAHVYNFQTQLIVSTAETVENKNTAALRNLDIDLFLQFDDYEEVKKEIDMEFPT